MTSLRLITMRARIATLQAGKIPIYEPNLDKVLEKRSARRAPAIYAPIARKQCASADVVFICVGTGRLYRNGGGGPLRNRQRGATDCQGVALAREAGDREKHRAGADG